MREEDVRGSKEKEREIEMRENSNDGGTGQSVASSGGEDDILVANGGPGDNVEGE